MRTFGCVMHVKETRPELKKLDDRSRPMIFVGYEAGTKGYRAYDPATSRVTITRDAVFDESAQWDWNSLETPVNTFGADMFTVEHMVLEPLPTPGDGSADPGSDSPPSPSPPAGSGTPPAGSPSTPASPRAESPTPTVTGVEFVSPPSRYVSTLDAKDDSNLEYRFRTLQNVLDAGPAMEPDEELHFLATEEPGSFSEAKSDASWRRAMEEEMSAIEENSTWRLTTLPPGHRAIGLKWVYKVKKDAQGAVLKHKARLVAKGYVQ
jgi:hypothetical protein